MPYNWNGEYVPSKADRTTDILGHKELGGIGQLVYHATVSKNMTLIISAMSIVLTLFAMQRTRRNFQQTNPYPVWKSYQVFVTLPVKSMILKIRLRM